jgi:hypothetical protein
MLTGLYQVKFVVILKACSFLLQLQRTLSLLPKLKELFLYGPLYPQGVLKLISSTLTTLKIKSNGESMLSDVRCPLLANLKLVGTKHVYVDGPVILRSCHWLEQWEGLVEQRVKEALKDPYESVNSVAWVSGQVAKTKTRTGMSLKRIVASTREVVPRHHL